MGESLWAKTVCSITVSNTSPTPVTLSLSFNILPGLLVLRDATAGGLSTNRIDHDQQAYVEFNIVSDRYYPNHLRERWLWESQLAGGRRGCLLTNYINDPQGLGIPVRTFTVSPDGTVLTEDWTHFSGTLDFGVLDPAQTFTLNYTVIVQTDGYGRDDSGASGALAMAGEPLGLKAGDSARAGSSFVFHAGDLVIGTATDQPVVLFDVARIGDRLRFSFQADANRGYAVESRDSLGAGGWTVLTNLPTQPNATTLDITNTLDSAQRYCRVRTP